MRPALVLASGDGLMDGLTQHDWRPLNGQVKGRVCQVCEVHQFGPEREGQPCHGTKRITVHVEGWFEMRVGNVWPDDDYPEEITAEAVKAVMEAQGSKHRVLDEWCITPDVYVSVGNGPEEEVWS